MQFDMFDDAAGKPTQDAAPPILQANGAWVTPEQLLLNNALSSGSLADALAVLAPLKEKALQRTLISAGFSVVSGTRSAIIKHAQAELVAAARSRVTGHQLRALRDASQRSAGPESGDDTVEFYQWQRNAEGGQTYGNMQTIEPLTESLFNQYVAARVAIKSFVDYRQQFPQATHISLVKQSDGSIDLAIGGVGALADLRPADLPTSKGWVKRVGSFTDPDAIAFGKSADTSEKTNERESQQETSEREWTENYDKVSNADDLSTVSDVDLVRAIAWASRRRQVEQRKGWDGGIVNQNLVDALSREIARIGTEESKRRVPTKTAGTPASLADLERERDAARADWDTAHTEVNGARLRAARDALFAFRWETLDATQQEQAFLAIGAIGTGRLVTKASELPNNEIARKLNDLLNEGWKPIADADRLTTQAPGTRINGDIERVAADRLEKLHAQMTNITERNSREGNAKANIRSVVEELRKAKTVTSVVATLDDAASAMDGNYSAFADVLREVSDSLQAKGQTKQEVSLDAQLVKLNAELERQGAVQNANTRAKRDAVLEQIAERDYPEILRAVDGAFSVAEELNRAFQFAGDEPKAKTIERILQKRGISPEYQARWTERLLVAQRQPVEPIAQSEAKPRTVNVPQPVSDAMSDQMHKQKARITRLRNEALKTTSLDDKKAAQLKVTAAEATLRKMRTSIFDAEDAAVMAVQTGDPTAFDQFADLFPGAAQAVADLTRRNEQQAQEQPWSEAEEKQLVSIIGRSGGVSTYEIDGNFVGEVSYSNTSYKYKRAEGRTKLEAKRALLAALITAQHESQGLTRDAHATTEPTQRLDAVTETPKTNANVSTDQAVSSLPEKRNIWIPKMTVGRLERLLAKPIKTDNDIEDLKDFKYFLLHDEQSAAEKGFMSSYVADGGAVRVLKNKYWLTNITAAIEEGPTPALTKGEGLDQARAVQSVDDGDSSEPLGTSAASNPGPVSSLFTGLPDSKNSAPFEALEAFEVGQGVEVLGRTFGQGTIETLFTRTLAGLEAIPMARLVRSDGKKLDIGLSELRPLETAKQWEPTHEREAPLAVASNTDPTVSASISSPVDANVGDQRGVMTERVTPASLEKMKIGMKVIDSNGQAYQAFSTRHEYVEVFPIGADGKAQVFAGNSVFFHLNPQTALSYPNRRHDPIYLVEPLELALSTVALDNSLKHKSLNSKGIYHEGTTDPAGSLRPERGAGDRGNGDLRDFGSESVVAGVASVSESTPASTDVPPSVAAPIGAGGRHPRGGDGVETSGTTRDPASPRDFPSTTRDALGEAGPASAGTKRVQLGMFDAELQAEYDAIAAATEKRNQDRRARLEQVRLQLEADTSAWDQSAFAPRIVAMLQSLSAAGSAAQEMRAIILSGVTMEAKQNRLSEESIAFRESVARRELARVLQGGQRPAAKWETLTSEGLAQLEPVIEKLPPAIVTAAVAKLNTLGEQLAAKGYASHYEVDPRSPADAREVADQMRDTVNSMLMLAAIRERIAKGHKNAKPEKLERMEDFATQAIGIDTRRHPGLQSVAGLTSELAASATPSIHSEEAEPKPTTVVIPPTLGDAIESDLQAQLERVMAARDASKEERLALEERLERQRQITVEEDHLRGMRLGVFDTQDAGIAALDALDITRFVKHSTRFPRTAQSLIHEIDQRTKALDAVGAESTVAVAQVREGTEKALHAFNGGGKEWHFNGFAPMSMGQALMLARRLEREGLAARAEVSKATTRFLSDLAQARASNAASTARSLRKEIAFLRDSYPDARADYESAVREASPKAEEPTVNAAPAQTNQALASHVGDDTQASAPKTGDAPSGVPTHPGTADHQDDFNLVEESEPAKRSATQRFRENVAAIKILRTLEAEGRTADRDERLALSRFVGWGGLKGVFDPLNERWSREHAELRELLSETEWKAASRSQLDAFYTHGVPVRAIYSAVQRLGFEYGRTLEPSVGVGNFFGHMPPMMRHRSKLHGVELDVLTSKIAAALYPKAAIAQATGFEKYKMPGGYFDMVIGNPPFGGHMVTDDTGSVYSGWSIHNYFFAKSVELLRPGGIMPMVVTHNFLDKLDPHVRRWISRRAELVSGVRLPNTAFKDNANTEVVTDILLFRRLDDANVLGKDETPDWLDTSDVTVEDPQTGESHTVTMNNYFIKNPQNVLGTNSATGSLYRANEYSVIANGDLETQLAQWVQSLPQGIYTPVERTETEQHAPVAAIPDMVKVGSFFVQGDQILERLEDDHGQQRAVPWVAPNQKAAERMRGQIKLRELLREQMRMERTLGTDASDQIEQHRRVLSSAYDAFKSAYGFVNDPINRRIFQRDTESALVEALEFDYVKAVSAAKALEHGIAETPAKAVRADILSRRVMFPPGEERVVETAKDALLHSLNATGRVDMGYMLRVYPKDEPTIVRELAGILYEDPDEGYVTADAYLSGDVKTKLAEATVAAQRDPALQRNVEALKAVIPKDKLPSEIHASLGAAWIPAKVYSDFVTEITGGQATLTYVKATAHWLNQGVVQADTAKNANEFGTQKMSAFDIMTHLMNSRVPEVKKKALVDGREVYVTDEAQTELVRERATKIRAHWDSWLWSDPERTDQLAQIYNNRFNRTVERQYDGSHLTFNGINSGIELLRHQKDGAWRGLQTRRLLLDQVVGAGKTFEIVSMVMEMRRLGIAKKPLLGVPNHLTLQWRSEFHRLYPGANILAASPSDFEKDNRERFFAKVATGNWDAVIVGHSSLKKIPVPLEAENKILTEQHDDISKAIEDLKRQRGDRNVIRDMEKIKANLSAKIDRLVKKAGAKDKVVDFSDLGVDAIAIDEFHAFKNLFFTTQMSRVGGLGNPAGSGKAFDLFVKFRWLEETFGADAPLITATGTPISNSLAEMFTVQRYMQYRELKDLDLHVFDAWAKQYGDVQNVYEVAPSGTGYRLSQRFSHFKNLGSLMGMYHSFADVLTLDDLKAQEAERGKVFPVPKLLGGRPVNIVAPRSKLQETFFGIPQVVRDDDGQVVFELNLRHATQVDKTKEGKYAIFQEIDDGSGTLRTHIVPGRYETQEAAEEALVLGSVTPTMHVDPKSIIGKFENLRQLTRETKGKVNALSLTSLANKAGLDYRLIDPMAPDFSGSKINLAVTRMVDLYHQWDADRGTQLVFCDLSVPLSAKARLASKEKRVYVRDDAGLLIHKRGTLHTIKEYEGLPYYLVQSRSGKEKTFTIYDAVSGVVMKEGMDSKQAAHAFVKSFIAQEAAIGQANGQERWLDQREKHRPISEDEIDEYKNENGLDEDGDAVDLEVSRQDIEGVTGVAGFSVYDDIKAKLLAAGIPPAEIQFIHDHDTPQAKADLFRRVNAGEVRFLLASTEKAGAGTNVQERLVGLHNIDAPWRPSDLEQREGRAIRRGNKLYERDPEGFRMFVGRYATSQTYDTRRWQILQHKATGLQQLRSYNGVNEIEDVASEAANSADMKAAASGNPLILRETQLATEVKALTLLERAHRDNQYADRRQIESSKQYIEKTGPKDKAFWLDLQKTRDSATVLGSFRGKAIVTKDELMNVIERIDEMTNDSTDPKFLVYRGCTFKFAKESPDSRYKTMWPPFGHGILMDSISRTGVVVRMDNWFSSIENHLQDIEHWTARAHRDIARLSLQVGQPFERAQDLQKATSEHAKVQRALVKSNALAAIQPEDAKAFDEAVARQKQLLASMGYSAALAKVEAAESELSDLIAPAVQANAPEPEALPEREPFEHEGVRIYPVTTKEGPRWAVQTPENRISGKVLGDTMHTTTDAAIQEANRQNARVQEEAQFAEAQQSQAQATLAQEEATNNVLGEFITQAGYSPMLAARARKSLQQLVRHEGAVVTSYAFVQALIAQGLIPNTREEDRIKPMSRMAEFRASNEEQRAHAKRVRDGGKKTVHFIGDYEVSSFEHAYAGYLQSQTVQVATEQPRAKTLESAPPVPNMEGYIKVAANSIQELRKVDVFRVLVESNRSEHRADIAAYIKAERPDLAEEVDDILREEGLGAATPPNLPMASLAPPAAEQVPTSTPTPQTQWTDGTLKQRRDMLHAAGYTDVDQARAISGCAWEDLAFSVQQRLQGDALTLDEAVAQDPRLAALQAVGVQPAQLMAAAREASAGDVSLMTDLARLHGLSLNSLGLEPAAPNGSIDIGHLKTRMVETFGVQVPDGWIVMNAPRPLLGTKTLEGDFVTGRHYAAIDPQDSMAKAYIHENVKLDARLLVQMPRETQMSMALVNNSYALQYMRLMPDERFERLAPTLEKLRDLPYAELKALVCEASQIVSEGEFTGPVVDVAHGVVTQRVGRFDRMVCHDETKLSEPIRVGAVIYIAYRNGVGQVRKEAERTQALGR